MTISDNPSAKRITAQIPTASGDMIEAWVYLPEGSGPHPAVVMAHGIGGIKAGGLAPFAERFREEGFAAIAFDYRNFGGSGGQPREVLSVPRQRGDYSTVIGWAGEQPYVDTRQIIAWGTSLPACTLSNSLSPTLDWPRRSPRLRSLTAWPQR
jgi:uncharacterized protein